MLFEVTLIKSGFVRVEADSVEAAENMVRNMTITDPEWESDFAICEVEEVIS